MSKDSLFKSQDIRKKKNRSQLKINFDQLFLDKVRDYFGENVAYYFAFLEFYTKALIPTAILGTFLYFILFINIEFIFFLKV